MSVRIKVEIDDAQLDAVLAKLKGAGKGGSKGIGKSKSVSGVTPSPSEEDGLLPTIPRGVRSAIGLGLGSEGYQLVSMYQKGLWLQRGIENISTFGLTTAALMDMFTFSILMIISIKQTMEEMKRQVEQHDHTIMELSDIHTSATYKEWLSVQNNPYRGRKP